ncbi:hypothetical protein ACSSUR_13735 [Pseudomonas cedrina]|uniref:hypothetical protein n=1 Tax=Pseudomonas cedrina TaxID=651740 RepID=UPI003ED8DD05
MQKNLRALFVPLLLCSSLTFAATGPAWESFGDWQVSKISDAMDPVTKVLIRTKFEHTSRPASGDGYVIGFRIIGRSIMKLDTMVNLGVDEFWPECDFDNASYSVDGSKVKYIATVESPGDCNTVPMNGELIKRFKSGRTARLKIDGVDGDISLNGFPAAWAKALKIAR